MTLFPVVYVATYFQMLDRSDHLIERAEAELSHDRAQLFSHEVEIVDDVLGLAEEPGPQIRILRGDTNRARVQVALPHHDAAHCHERGGRKAELVGAVRKSVV